MRALPHQSQRGLGTGEAVTRREECPLPLTPATGRTVSAALGSTVVRAGLAATKYRELAAVSPAHAAPVIAQPRSPAGLGYQAGQSSWTPRRGRGLEVKPLVRPAGEPM